MSAPDPILDAPAIANAEVGLAMLARAAELGMKLLGTCEPAPGWLDHEIRQAALDYVPISRALRLTIILQARLHKDMRDLKSGVVPPSSKALAPPAAPPIEPAAALLAEPVQPEVEEAAERPESLYERSESLTADLETEGEDDCPDLPAAVERAWSAVGVEIDLSAAAPASSPSAVVASVRYGPRNTHKPPTFTEQLRERVLAVIRAEAEDGEALAELYGLMERRLARGETYMSGRHVPLRDAVRRLCEDLGLTPDWGCWRDDNWVRDRPLARRRDVHPPPSAHALE